MSADLVDAGMASPADFAGVVAADVTTLANAEMVTVGVTDLADAGMAFPADITGVVSADVATLADAEMVTVGVATGRGLSVCQLCGLGTDGGVWCGAGC